MLSEDSKKEIYRDKATREQRILLNFVDYLERKAISETILNEKIVRLREQSFTNIHQTLQNKGHKCAIENESYENKVSGILLLIKAHPSLPGALKVHIQNNFLKLLEAISNIEQECITFEEQLENKPASKQKWYHSMEKNIRTQQCEHTQARQTYYENLEKRIQKEIRQPIFHILKMIIEEKDQNTLQATPDKVKENSEETFSHENTKQKKGQNKQTPPFTHKLFEKESYTPILESVVSEENNSISEKIDTYFNKKVTTTVDTFLLKIENLSLETKNVNTKTIIHYTEELTDLLTELDDITESCIKLSQKPMSKDEKEETNTASPEIEESILQNISTQFATFAEKFTDLTPKKILLAELRRAIALVKEMYRLMKLIFIGLPKEYRKVLRDL